MSSDSSNCPEDSNSTDCLLRTLIQLVSDQPKADDAEYNWDPVTFVFTAIIGIIAIVFAAFALIPIVQTFLTAGRANRRTSERAIGKWSQNRERRWNRSEWTIDFITKVPIFRADNLLPNMEKVEENYREATGAFRVNAGSEQATDTKTQSWSQAHQHAATWVNLFERLGLDQVGMIDDLLRPVDISFLPDDLVAAPAYAEIRLIISAAAIMPDAHTLLLEEKSGVPVMIGHGFQFEFRQHPLLGLVGAFLSFDDKTYSPLRFTELGRGIVACRWRH